MKNIFLIVFSLISMTVSSFSVGFEGKLAEKKQTPQQQYVTAKEAFELVTSSPKEILFLDVRTRPELEFVGWSPLIDGNIPYVTKDLDSWDPKKSRFKNVANSNFLLRLEELLVQKKLTKDSHIILMCRSGSRSAKAANLLFKAGYRNVTSVIDGFEGDKSKDGFRMVNGWKNTGLPWSYKLEKGKMYWEF